MNKMFILVIMLLLSQNIFAESCTKEEAKTVVNDFLTNEIDMNLAHKNEKNLWNSWELKKPFRKKAITFISPKEMKEKVYTLYDIKEEHMIINSRNFKEFKNLKIYNKEGYSKVEFKIYNKENNFKNASAIKVHKENGSCYILLKEVSESVDYGTKNDVLYIDPYMYHFKISN